jgi:hypothetical protein
VTITATRPHELFTTYVEAAYCGHSNPADDPMYNDLVGTHLEAEYLASVAAWEEVHVNGSPVEICLDSPMLACRNCGSEEGGYGDCELDITDPARARAAA